LFSSVGSIADVRLVGQRGRVHKGYAYVEFEDVDSVQVIVCVCVLNISNNFIFIYCIQAALKLDRECIDERPVYVSQYKLKQNIDPHKQPAKEFAYTTGLEKNKLFVRGLPITAKPHDVEVFIYFII
jgi:hypothetical protein